MVCKQYIALDDFGTTEEVDDENERIRCVKSQITRRRFGVIKRQLKKAVYSRAPKKRLKTYHSLCQLAKTVEQCFPISLADIRIEKLADGSWPNPWLWPSVAISPDRGSDMSCLVHFGQYKKHLNLPVNWDWAHLCKTSTRKILKKMGLWSHAVSYAAAANCVYGSMLSPARMNQIRQSVQHVMETIHPTSDEHFMAALPFLVEQLPLKVSMATPDVEKIVHKYVHSHKTLHTKGQQINLGKVGAVVYHALRSMPSFSLKGYVFTTACIALGCCCTYIGHTPTSPTRPLMAGIGKRQYGVAYM